MGELDVEDEPEGWGGPVMPPEQAVLMADLGAIADELFEVMSGRVREAMAKAGEDPASAPLFGLRCAQAAYSINSRAERLRRA